MTGNYIFVVIFIDIILGVEVGSGNIWEWFSVSSGFLLLVSG